MPWWWWWWWWCSGLWDRPRLNYMLQSTRTNIRSAVGSLFSLEASNRSFIFSETSMTSIRSRVFQVEYRLVLIVSVTFRRRRRCFMSLALYERPLPGLPAHVSRIGTETRREWINFSILSDRSTAGRAAFTDRRTFVSQYSIDPSDTGRDPAAWRILCAASQ